jgi:hypothetical protein
MGELCNIYRRCKAMWYANHSNDHPSANYTASFSERARLLSHALLQRQGNERQVTGAIFRLPKRSMGDRSSIRASGNALVHLTIHASSTSDTDERNSSAWNAGKYKQLLISIQRRDIGDTGAPPARAVVRNWSSSNNREMIAPTRDDSTQFHQNLTFCQEHGILRVHR